MMRNLSDIRYNDNIEGDFKYVANEVLYVTNENFKTIDLKKADVFALAMSLIDIVTSELIRREASRERSKMA